MGENGTSEKSGLSFSQKNMSLTHKIGDHLSLEKAIINHYVGEHCSLKA